MNSFFATLLALVGLVVVCYADMSSLPSADNSSLTTISDEDLTDMASQNSTQLNATVAGNNVLVTRSNIFVVGDRDKGGVIDFIKNLVIKGSSAQSNDALTTQIIAVLGADNNTSSASDVADKMIPKIKSALQSRDKPAQLHQAIVKLTEMSPKFGADKADKYDV